MAQEQTLSGMDNNIKADILHQEEEKRSCSETWI
jgi:hypothetical protein